MGKPLRIDFVSDVACPWCVVGLRSLLQALDAVGDKVEAAYREMFSRWATVQSAPESGSLVPCGSLPEPSYLTGSVRSGWQLYPLAL